MKNLHFIHDWKPWTQFLCVCSCLIFVMSCTSEVPPFGRIEIKKIERGEQNKEVQLFEQASTLAENNEDNLLEEKSSNVTEQDDGGIGDGIIDDAYVADDTIDDVGIDDNGLSEQSEDVKVESIPEEHTSKPDDNKPTDPAKKWLQKNTIFGSAGYETARSIAVASSGSVYITGSFEKTLTIDGRSVTSKGSTDIYIAKYSKQGKLSWLKSFGGKGLDAGDAIVVGKDGIYMSARFLATIEINGRTYKTSSGGVLLLKLGVDGSYIWSKRIYTNVESISSLALDSKDNIIITCGFLKTVEIYKGLRKKLHKAGSKENTLIVKFDSSSKVLWSLSFGNSYANVPNAITVDSYDHVLVTGYFAGAMRVGPKIINSVGAEDIFVVKFDSVGNLKGAFSFGSVTNDKGTAIASDTKGNTYIAGEFGRSLTIGNKKLETKAEKAIFLIKINTNTNIVWATAFKSRGKNKLNALTVDHDGNTYLTGSFNHYMRVGHIPIFGISGNTAFVSKHSSDGKARWALSLEISSGEGQSLANDNKGHIFVAGKFYGGFVLQNSKQASQGYSDAFFLKLRDKADNTACNSNNDCPLSSHCKHQVCAPNEPKSCLESLYPYCLSKQEVSASCTYINGSLHYQEKQACPTTTTCSWGQCLLSCKQDSDCRSNQVCSNQVCKAKVGEFQAGKRLQTQIYSATKHVQQNGRVTIAGAASDDIRIADKKHAPKSYYDSFVAAFRNNGVSLWTLFLSSSDSTSILSMVVDSSNNTYITGFFEGMMRLGHRTLVSKGSRDIFLAKISPSGTVLWASSYGSSNKDEGRALTLDASGNIYLAGVFYTSVFFGTKKLVSRGSQDAFLVKISNQGQVLWGLSAGETKLDAVRSVKVDNQGFIYLLGSFQSKVTVSHLSATGAGLRSMFVLKIDSQGNPVWLKTILGPGSIYSTSIIVNKLQEIYLSGYFSKSINIHQKALHSHGKHDVLLAKMSSDGKILWTSIIGSIEHDSPGQISFDAQENVYITGSFYNKLHIGSTTLTSQKLLSIFALKYSPAGKLLWSKSLDKKSERRGVSIHIDSSGHITLATAQGNLLFFVP